MTPERFRQVESIFAQALTAAPSERESILTQACDADADLRREVEKLLTAHDNAGAFMNQPATGQFEALRDAINDSDRSVGRRFGAYETIERIGAGGMGAVYLARRSDDQFDKRVAIKVIHWWMDTTEILRRFERERRVLARLQHPNIAMLLDAGMDEEGVPFIVMEYVDGEPIDRHCAERAAPLERRLELFLSACDAVQAAHNSLIVHLDLKPSNILVSGDGLVKLVDFGIARLVDLDQDFATRTDARPFTPAYAAPEQISGDPLTTATDVYSLGVVLYELLTGERPFKTTSEDMRQVTDAILHTPPARPSTVVATGAHEPTARQNRRLARRLQGDLDNIALMAMRKEPQRRYPSVQALADDIRRHLAGRTVAARPDTFSYRTSRFIRRNRLPVAASLIVFLSLLAGMAGVSWQAHETAQQRDRAERRFSDLRNLTTTLIEQVDRDLAEIPGATEARRAVITQATQHLDSLAAEAENEPDLLAELALSYSQLGALQRNFIGSHIGDTAAATASHRKALVLRERVLAMKPGDPIAMGQLAQSHVQIGDMMRAQGELDQAVTHYRRCADLFEGMIPTNDQLRIDKEHNRGVVLLKLGIVHAARGDYTAAADAYEEALDVNRALFESDTTLLVTRRNMAVSYEKLGDIAEGEGDAEAALDHYLHSLEIFQDLESQEPGEARHIISIVIAYSKIGEVRGHPAYANLGDVEGATEAYRKGRRLIGELLRVDPANAQARMIAAFFDRRLGAFLSMEDRHDEALEHLHAALTESEAIADANPADVQSLTDVASTRQAIADAHAAMDQPEDALDWTRRAIEAHQAVLEINGELVGTRVELAASYRAAGESCAAIADEQPDARRADYINEACEWLARSVSVYEQLESRGQLRTAAVAELASARERLEELRRTAATFADAGAS